MEVAYWVVGGLLAAFNVYAGGVKLVRSQEALRPMMGWVDTVPMAGVRAIGALEVLGAIGLIVPPAVGVATALALAAAIGFLLLQILATALHFSRREARLTPLNWALIAVAAAAAWLGTVWI